MKIALQVTLIVCSFMIGLGFGFQSGRVYQIRSDTAFFYFDLAQKLARPTPIPTPTPDDKL